MAWEVGIRFSPRRSGASGACTLEVLWKKPEKALVGHLTRMECLEPGIIAYNRAPTSGVKAKGAMKEL